MNKTKETSLTAIKAAIDTLEAKGIKATQLNVSTETGLSIRTVKRHWGSIRVTVNTQTSDIRVTITSNRVTENKSTSLIRVSSFDRFKRRADKSTMGISYVNPSEF